MQKSVFFAVCLSAGWIYAQTCHVVPPGTESGLPADPFNSWQTAATNIQDAVQAAATNGWATVLVSNGTYLLADRISISNAITVRSWNNGALDRESTIVDGNNYPGKPVTNPCFYLDHTGIVLAGLTIRGGNSPSGGAIFAMKAGTISNCAIVNNAASSGGGAWIYTSGTFVDCVIASNTVGQQGGGLYMRRSASVLLSGCEVSMNVAGNRGGGVLAGVLDAAAANLVASNCVFASNRSDYAGGAIYLNRGRIVNSLLVSNTAPDGGGIYYNCLSGQTHVVEIENCTLADNAAGTGGGGIYFTDLDSNTGLVLNTILYGNSAGGAYSNWYLAGVPPVFSNSCTAPLSGLPGGANLDADPLFANRASGNYRLAAGSPCINAGMNRAWMQSNRDLDGGHRLDGLYHKVDIGCYERIGQGTFLMIR